MARQTDHYKRHENKKMKKLPKITLIKANANDSAAFDANDEVMFTWGSFGQLRLCSDEDGSRDLQKTPRQLELYLMKAQSTLEWSSETLFRQYAVPVDNNGNITIPGMAPEEMQKLQKSERIKYLLSIDWGINHCILVDK